VVGLLAGAAARLIVPGRTEIGLIGCLSLGVIGAVIGGLLGNMIVGAREFSLPGLVGSVAGGIGALVAYRAASGHRTA
jgi:uncharacterized membrane protein YeaQ/YmgE (transglycosylase-associated protein family)